MSVYPFNVIIINLPDRYLSKWRRSIMTAMRGEDTGITPRQIEVLTLLMQRDCWLVSEIATQLGVSSAAATKAITRLEKRGLVTRSIDLMDRRCVQVRVTRAAQEIVRQVAKSM
jgi:DNA-binding MarR family transcriptional regulator